MGETSKLKAKDKICFDFNRSFDIDLYAVTYKEQKRVI